VGKSSECQYIYIIDKNKDGNVSTEATLGVRYVPLTSEQEQLKNY
jgi:protein-L-isoaspartate O-methyltransferase